ncbi:hypothetical protein M8C21_019498, partial [Ambrosia artemisiifolia]
ELSIQGMDAIKVIGLECTSTASVTFPALEILKFEVEELSIEHCDEIRHLWESNVEASKVSSCKKLVSLGEKEEDEDNIGSNLLSSLRKLVIRSCESMERLCCPNSIESLHINGYNSIKQVSFPGATTTDCESIESFGNLQLPNLTDLDIISCKNMKEIRDLQIPNLISWSIIGCKNLESIPEVELCNLTLLRDMRITSCPMTDASFPGGIWPSNLQSLEIGGLKKPISEWGYQNFPASLVKLVLYNGGEVRNLSELSHLFPSSLTSLNIYAFKNLESFSMGLQHLTSLQHLQIWECPEVKDLPETLLPTLLSLTIEGASYSVVILAGLGIAAAASYGVFKELIFEPKKYKVFNKALRRIQDESQVRVRMGHRLPDTVKKAEIEQPDNGSLIEFGKTMMVLSMLRFNFISEAHMERVGFLQRCLKTKMTNNGSLCICKLKSTLHLHQECYLNHIFQPD